jgi:hypothetical protein
MSVITDLTATPARVDTVYRYLAERRDESRDDLILLLSPRALRRQSAEGDASDRSAREVFSACRALGVMQPIDGDDGRVQLGNALRDGRGARPLLPYLETVLLQPEAAESHGQGAFPLALAWFLAQDPTQPLRLENVRRLLEDQQGDVARSYNLTNPQVFQNLVYWARYLGFAWRLGLEKSEEVVPDPTEAIRRHLSKVVPTGDRVPLHLALQRLAQHLPVLEGGAARSIVDERMAGAYRRAPDYLSRSTSLALTRLDDRKAVILESLSDAPITLLDTLPTVRAVTHIRRLENRA